MVDPLDSIETGALIEELGLSPDSVRASLSSDEWIKDYFLYEDGVKPPRILNNLASAYQFWEKLSAPKDILDIVKEGYKIPFMQVPPTYKLNNNKSALENSEFVSKAVLELLEANLIEECENKPHIVSPLSVSSHNGKQRLILDLSVMNNCILSEKFTIEDQNTFFQYCKGQENVSTFDIKSCYHQIAIHADHQTYLGFEWNIGGKINILCLKFCHLGCRVVH